MFAGPAVESSWGVTWVIIFPSVRTSLSFHTYESSELPTTTVESAQPSHGALDSSKKRCACSADV
ncbi:hypothetical protein AU198_12005 [Mycobacterium sp. GA-1199]|nr:hypothetical protein AU198_12005 [Mycobacterium sp. GA-1199]